MQANNYCEEEMKMVNETKRIMGLEDLMLTATCVRVPVLRAHSESVNIEFARPFPVEEAQMILRNASGIELIEDFILPGIKAPASVIPKCKG